MDPFINKVQGRLINNRWSLRERLGKGGFGAVHRGIEVSTRVEIALKLEHKSIVPSVLEEEVERYKCLAKLDRFPKVYWFGQHDDYKVMAFELLGPSLEDLFEYCDRRFSLKTTLLLLDQILLALEDLHSVGLAHRDMKPRNLLMGSMTPAPPRSEIAPADKVDSWAQQDLQAFEVIVQKVDVKSVRLMLYTDKPAEQTQRDDLESLGYVMVYFMKGSVPWQGQKVHGGKEKEQATLEIKLRTTIADLCQDLPMEFASYFKQVASLQCGESPDYEALRQMFRTLAIHRDIEYDFVYDWTIRLFQRQQSTIVV